jgi:putative tryptophan/tyrosine transport system substrate-binding protein
MFEHGVRSGAAQASYVPDEHEDAVARPDERRFQVFPEVARGLEPDQGLRAHAADRARSRARVMNRRTFLCGLTLGTVTTPLCAEALQAGQVYRVGFIFLNSPVSEMAGPEPVHYLARTFVQALQALGYVEGQNLILERRSAEGQNERLGGIVAELVRLKADVIVTGGDPLPGVAKAVTTTVPIVMTSSPDPVGAGLVQSLARPGGNVTGLTTWVGAELAAKRLELLREMLPRVSRVAYLSDTEDKDWEGPRGKAVRTAAQALGVTLVRTEFTRHQYTDAFAGITRARANALFVASGAAVYADRALIVDFATRTRLPSTFGNREAVDLGALMSYGANLADNYRRAATYVDKILKGAKPADLPVEQPTKFELVINMKTAKTLGLTIPQSVLGRADQVIE